MSTFETRQNVRNTTFRICGGLLLALCVALTASSVVAQTDGDATLVKAPVASDAAPARGWLMPDAISSFGAALHDNHIYVFGGHTGRAHAHSRDNVSRNFRRRALNGSTWESLPGGRGLQGTALVAVEEGLVRIGGVASLNAADEEEDMHSTDSVELYSPTTRRWRDLPSLPEGRSSHDAVVAGRKIWVIGGWNLQGDADEAAWATEALVLDMDRLDEGWTPTPQGFVRRALAVATFGQKILSFGGLTYDAEMSRRVDVYDPKTRAWTVGPEIPGGAFGCSAFETADGLFLSIMDGRLFRLSDDAASWKTVTRLAFPRFFHRLIPAGPGRLAFLAGASRLGHLAHAEFIETGAETPTWRTLHLRIPYTGRARNRQATVVRKTSVELFGGNDGLGQHEFEPDSFSDEAWSLDLGSLRFRPQLDLSFRRQSMSAVRSHLGETWLLGGFGHNGTGAVSFNTVFAKGKKGQRFAPGAFALPDALSQFGATVHEGRLWLFGGAVYGQSEKGDTTDITASIRSASLEAPGEFRVEGASLGTPRRAFGAATLDGRHYVIGGITDGFQVVKDCVAYDFAKAEVVDVADAEPRISPEVAAYDGRIFVVGGSSPDGKGFRANPKLEVFDPATGAWTTVLEDLPFTARQIHMVALSQGLLLMSTHNDRGEADVLFVNPSRPKALARDPHGR